MMTVIGAKWGADLICDGLYDIHIHLRGIPFLEQFPDDEMERVAAADVMNKGRHQARVNNPWIESGDSVEVTRSIQLI